jgi:hypothetical protein
MELIHKQDIREWHVINIVTICRVKTLKSNEKRIYKQMWKPEFKMTIKCSLNMTDVISRTTLWKLMYEVFICLYKRCFFFITFYVFTIEIICSKKSSWTRLWMLMYAVFICLYIQKKQRLYKQMNTSYINFHNVVRDITSVIFSEHLIVILNSGFHNQYNWLLQLKPITYNQCLN